MTSLSIKEIQFSHFRSHKIARLKLDGRPIAIYGPNGAGKTNILEAVSLLSPGRGLRRAKADEMARQPELLGWKVSGVLQSLHQTHEVSTSAENGMSRSVRIDEKTTSQAALGRIARVLWLVPSMDRLWLEGADGRRRFLDRMTMSFEPSHADAVLTYEKAMRERNRLLKDQVSDPMWYRALEAQMATAGTLIMQNRRDALARIEDVEVHNASAFPAAELAITDADELDNLEEVFANSRSQDIRAGRTLVGPHRIDLSAIYATKNIEAKQCSTGEQKALLISLILANARALIDDFGAPPILLLDEVAAHLDADRRAALYDEICALGAQAWMTGTGVELFDALGDRAQYFEVTEENGESVVTERK